jgi:glycosyltransferase involved in cell wall biosynthesis
MSVQKDPVTVVRALSLLQDLSWSCVMIGEGPLARDVREEIVRTGLQERIELRGWVPSEGVAAAMRDSEILLIPSLSEGLPMVAIEALANGLAIAGSRIGGLDDVLEDRANGITFDLLSGAEGFATALRPMLADADTLVAARRVSLEKARNFDLEPSLTAYEEIFNEVVK